MAMRVTRAGVGLIIGIIVLAGLVWGGLYLVKQRGEVARRNETLKIAEQKLNDESNKDVAIDQDNKNSTSTTDKNEDKSGSSSSASNANDSANKSENLPSTGPSQSVTELPQTGVTDILAIVPLVAITFAGGSYVASRKALR